MKIKPVLYPLSLLLIGLALVEEVPVFLDVYMHNDDWKTFQASICVTLFFGIAILFISDRNFDDFKPRHAYLLTCCSWVIISFFAALPILWSSSNVSLTDSMFEATSGLTTTGATIFSHIEDLPPGILLWRSMLQWIGGIGIVVIAISFFPVMKIGGLQLFKTESSETSDKAFPRIKELAFGIFCLYALFTVICAGLYFVEGMTPFDSIIHAMTTLSTGGFSTRDASMSYFDNIQIIWTAIIFMVIGSLPFSLMLISVKRIDLACFFNDSQVVNYLKFLFVICIFCTYFLYDKVNGNLTDVASIIIFNVISVITTTGYAYDNYMEWGVTSPLLFFFLIFIGGCSGSTSGGIKFFRFQILWLHLKKQLKLMVYPHGVFPISLNQKPVSDEICDSVLVYIFLFIVSVTIIAILLSTTGLDFQTSLSAAATAIANVGPGIGSIVGPDGNYSVLSDFAKWVLLLSMILGRLEFIALLIMTKRRFWVR